MHHQSNAVPSATCHPNTTANAVLDRELARVAKLRDAAGSPERDGPAGGKG